MNIISCSGIMSTISYKLSNYRVYENCHWNQSKNKYFAITVEGVGVAGRGGGVILQNSRPWIMCHCLPPGTHGLTLIIAWISNYIHYKVCDKIAYPLPNLKKSLKFGKG